MTARDQHVHGPTVLCVDDEPHVLRALERLLRRYGCHVLTAENGSDALDLLERERVEVMICDEAMPGMCGTEVLRQAKLISPQTARILLTAHCNDQAVVIPAVNDSEVFRLLSKPWEDREIRCAVTDALGLEPKRWCQDEERVRERMDSDRSAAGVCETAGPRPKGTDVAN